jgi:L-alanine-DL-glutamate epimerase-like enolase superfamily enzyme
MSRPSDIRVLEARSQARRIAYRAPIKFGGRVVTDVTMLDVQLDVVTRDGKRATGYGSMPLGNVWAWPSSASTTEQTLAAMRELGERFASACVDPDLTGHPLEVAQAWHARRTQIAAEVVERLGIPESMPVLAQMVAASPAEAALFDAQGRALGANSYQLLSADFMNHDLSRWLGDDFRGHYLDRYTRATPQPRMPLYHLVGALDPLTAAEVSQPVGDGLPETLGEWIHADGLTHLKIKLNGDNLQWDVERVVGVDRVAREAQAARGCPRWYYSLDFNERCQDVEYVLDFLQQLRERAADGFDRVQYIEQPTHRDLAGHRHLRMHAAARIKPVVIDESLVDLESLHLSRELGYSGIALKSCKGHGEALLMGAAAQHYGLFLCVQDLTCPGASFLHSASLAARIPTVAAIEGNSRQYCPAGNEGWRTRYPSAFQVRSGTIDTSVLDELGLGFDGSPLPAPGPTPG